MECENGGGVGGGGGGGGGGVFFFFFWLRTNRWAHLVNTVMNLRVI